MESLYHFLPASEYSLDDQENLTRPSLVVEGFIHCSTRDQVCAVANRLAPERSDLLLLKIDPSRIPSEIIYENLEGGQQLFPHIYGPIPGPAVLDVAPFEWDAANHCFNFPAKFE